MGLSHYVFVGALMHVKVKPTAEEVGYWMCENDHNWGKSWYMNDKNFCPKCGKPIQERMVLNVRMPNMYQLFPDKWIDRLSGNFEHDGCEDGEIIMFSNDGIGVICSYDRDDAGYTEILPSEQERCVNEFNEAYSDMIDHLRPQAESIRVFFGAYSYCH